MNVTKRKRVIFDADDTLWETTPLYTEARQRFDGLMADSGLDLRVAVVVNCCC